MPSWWYHSRRSGSVVISAGSWTGTTAGLEHEPGRVRLADLEQAVAAEAVGAGHALRQAGPEVDAGPTSPGSVGVTSGQAGSSASSAITRRTEMSW